MPLLPRVPTALTALALLLPGALLSQVRKTISLKHGGIDRSYLLHVPAGIPEGTDGSRAVPLVLDFHGWTATPANQAQVSGFQAKADTHGFVVAWPQGLGNSWNAGACCGKASSEKVDDVGFARAVAADIQARYTIDRSRMYVTGHSNGGAMTQRLAAEAGDLFAAAAGVAGMLLVPAAPRRPVPIINFHAYGDRTVPYQGIAFIPAAAAAFRTWGKADKCQGEPATVILSGVNKCETFASCQDGAEVSLCSIEANHVTYVNKPGLDIADMAWTFLSRFALDPSASIRSSGRIPERSAAGGWTGGPGQSTAGASPGGAWLFHGPETSASDGASVDGGIYFIDGRALKP